jgi:hypothetical protein
MKDKDKDGDPCSIDVPVPSDAQLHEIVGAIEDALELRVTDLTNCKSASFTINLKFK